MKAIEIVKKFKALRKEQDKAPWSTIRLFQAFSYEVIGEQISFGEDYVSIHEAREGVQFLVDQLGGKVKWGKDV